MTPEQLADTVRDALASLVADGALELADGIPEVRIERPRVREHGDYASNIALQLARTAGRPPRDIATLLADRLVDEPGVATVDVAGPGFLNVRVSASAQAEVAPAIVSAGPAYGRGDAAVKLRVNLEFVSANPTGPLTLGSGRWAAVGDSLGRLLEAVGADVTREYYFNDHGAQVDRFSASLLARARGQEPPADGYGAAYIAEIARRVCERVPEVTDQPDDTALETFRREGIALMFAEIKQSLHDFRVDFDVFFHEQSLHDRGEVEEATDRLRSSGLTYEADGALWLRSREYGDDKDRVLVRRDGRPTYIAADAAYYLDKRQRGFNRVVIMLGADHHGYVGRYRALAAAFGDDPDEHLEILIGQLVSLVRGGRPVRMSKRAGDVITLDDLVEVVGNDAARYAMARYSADSPIDIELDLWASRSNDNPVYYVQYAHARLASILRNAVELGLSAATADRFRAELIDHPREGDLLRELADYPRVVRAAADLREVHRIARYLEQVAATFHRFYDDCRVLPVGDEEPGERHAARLTLVEATRTVLANGLALLGVSAPARM